MWVVVVGYTSRVRIQDGLTSYEIIWFDRVLADSDVPTVRG